MRPRFDTGRRLAHRAALVLALSCAAPLAQAQPLLRYDVAAGCPDREAFSAAVSARGARLDDVDSGVRELRVRIVRFGATHRGSLELSLPGASPSAPRSVQGETCSEVVDALAVVTAIALRGEPEAAASTSPSDDRLAVAAIATTLAVSSPPADSSRAAPAPAPREGDAIATAATEPAPRGRLRTTGDVISPFAAQREVPVEAGTLRFDRLFTLSLSAGAAIGVLPGQVVPRLELSTRRTTFVTTPSGENLLVGPSYRARISVVGPSTRDSADTSTEVFGLSSAIGPCVNPAYDSEGLVIELCPLFGIGFIQVDTTDAAGNQIQSKTVGYGSFGISVGAHYNIGKIFQLSLEVGGDLTTQPVTAERADGSRIFRSSVIFASDTFSGFGIQGHVVLGVGLQL